MGDGEASYGSVHALPCLMAILSTPLLEDLPVLNCTNSGLGHAASIHLPSESISSRTLGGWMMAPRHYACTPTPT